MNAPLSKLMKQLIGRRIPSPKIIPWSSPIPSFGQIFESRVATLGLNPSKREFVDRSGVELDGPDRRFHTLNSLGLECWSDATRSHAGSIWESCSTYFFRNPYDTWFRQLDDIITATNSSYYDRTNSACHLDLVPYATECRWTELRRREQAVLLAAAVDSLAILIRHSSIRLLILNGRSVVSNFESLAGIEFERTNIKEWDLKRSAQPNVMGIGYCGSIDQLLGVPLGRKVRILGFNHNIQSSFGVSGNVRNAIRSWIGGNS